ncbi:hypothetical protein [Azospirillum argentinense]|uniref:hypothetical protein n=1 Tax=Azospirillum argentinense TaxID=2970906 RepID=UPI0032DED2B3
MAFVYPDCTSEITTSTGIAAVIILEGPEPSFGAFSHRMAVGDETTVRREDGLNFELLRVRLLAPGSDSRFRLEVLTRLDSSNSGAPVNWSAGQQRVFAVQLGRYALLPPDTAQAGRPVVVQPDGTFGPGSVAPGTPGAPTLGILRDVAVDGAVSIRLVITWAAVAGGVTYEALVRDGLTSGFPGNASSGATYPAGDGLRLVLPVLGGYSYGVRLRARTAGGASDYGPEATIAATGDTQGPTKPSGVTTGAALESAWLAWTNPTAPDFDRIRIWVNSTSVEAGRSLLWEGRANRYTDTGLAAGQTRYYWLEALDASGNTSGFTGPYSATTGTLTQTSFPSDLVPPKSLAGTEANRPTSTANKNNANLGGGAKLVYWAGRLYSWNGDEWFDQASTANLAGTLQDNQLPSVISASRLNGVLGNVQLDGSKISGTLLSGQIPALDASKIVNGTLDAARVPALQSLTGAIQLTQFAAGIRPVEIVDTLPATGNTQGRTVLLKTDNKLYRWTGTAWTASVPAGDVTGQITKTQISDGAISTPKLEAGAVTASKLVISPANLCADPWFMDDGYWTADAGGWLREDNTGSNATSVLGSRRSAILWDGMYTGTARRHIYTRLTPYSAADRTLRLRARGYALNVGTQKVYVDLHFRNKDAQWIGSVPVYWANGEGPSVKEVQGVVPAGTCYIQVYVYNDAVGPNWVGVAAITDIEVCEAATGKMVVDGAVSANHLTADSVVAGKIAAGAVSAREVQAGAIVASKIAVMDTTNLVPDSELADPASWGLGAGWTHVPAQSKGFTSMGAMRYGWVAAGTAPGAWGAALATGLFPVNDSREYFVSYQLAPETATKVRVWGRVHWSDATGAVVNGGSSGLTDLSNVDYTTIHDGVVTGSGVRTLSKTLRPPPGARRARILCYVDRYSASTDGDLSVGSPEVRVRQNADLIVDGTITASKLAITDLTNYVNNPIFAQDLSVGWRFEGYGTGSVTRVLSSAAGVPAGALTAYVAKMVRPSVASGSNFTSLADAGLYTVTPGEEYFFSVECAAETATNFNLELRVQIGDATGAINSWPQVATRTPGATWATLNGSYKVPAGTRYLRVLILAVGTTMPVAGAWYVTNVQMRRKNAGELIVDGAIFARHVAAEAISAKHITIGDTSNMVTNPDFLVGGAGSLDGWQTVGAVTLGDEGTVKAWGRCFARTYQRHGLWWGKSFPVAPGEVYYLGVWVHNTAAERANVMAEFADQAGTAFGWTSAAGTDAKNAWTFIDGTVTVPAGATSMKLVTFVEHNGSANFTAWGRFTLRRAMAGKLIVDGAITSDKVAANAVTAGKIAANAITAREVQAGAITASKIALVPGNLCADPWFADPSYWTADAGGWFVEDNYANSTTANLGVRRAYVLWSGTYTGSGRKHVWGPTIPYSGVGRTLVFRARGSLSSNASDAFYFQLQCLDRDQQWLGGTEIFWAQGETATKERQYQIPNGTCFIRWVFCNQAAGASFVGVAAISEIEVHEAASAEMLVDGAVIARKIAAEAVTATKLVIGNPSNIIPDGTFKDLNFWLAGPGSTARKAGDTIVSTNGANNATSRNGYIRLADTGLRTYYSQYFPIRYSKYRVRWSVWLSSDFVGAVAVLLHQPLVSWNTIGAPNLGGHPSDLNIPYQFNSSTTAKGQVLTFEGTIDNPSQASNSTVRAQFRFTINSTAGEFQAGDFELVQVSGTTLIEDGAVTTDKVAANAVTTNLLAAGAVTADKVAANSITASKVAIGDFTNLVPDEQIQDPAAWVVGAGWSHGAAATSYTLGSRGRWNFIEPGTTGWSAPLQTKAFPVDPSRSYLFGYRQRTDAAGQTAVLFRAVWLDQNYALLSYTDLRNDTLVGNAAQAERTASATPPAGARFCSIYFYAERGNTTSNLSIGGIYCRLRNAGDLIVDGAITTNHLQVNSINGDRITTNTLTGNKIQAGTITGDRLALGFLKLDYARVISWSGNTAAGPAAGLYINGSPRAEAKSRGLCAWSFDRANHTFVEYRNWDTVGNYAIAAGDAANWLNAQGDGRVVFVISHDSYQVLDDGLFNALKRIGASRAVLQTSNTNDPVYGATVRCPYVLIGWGGLGEGNGLEMRLGFQATGPAEVSTFWGDSTLTGIAAGTGPYTLIEPGRIVIQGSTTLDSWRDQTEIKGGAIKANTVNGDRIIANTINGDRITADTIGADRLKANTITSRELTTNTLITQSAQLGTATVTSLKIGLNQVTIPNTDYVPDSTPLWTGGWTHCAATSIDCYGQPIIIWCSLMQVIESANQYSQYSYPLFKFRIQRGVLNAAGNDWVYTDLLPELGGTAASGDITGGVLTSGMSQPWTYIIVDRTPLDGPARNDGTTVPRAYRLLASKVMDVDGRNTAVAYRSISIMEARR